MIKTRDLVHLPFLSKVPEAQCEILILQSYEKKQNEWVL